MTVVPDRIESADPRRLSQAWDVAGVKEKVNAKGHLVGPIVMSNPVNRAPEAK
jgi:hypothetical protein